MILLFLIRVMLIAAPCGKCVEFVEIKKNAKIHREGTKTMTYDHNASGMDLEAQSQYSVAFRRDAVVAEARKQLQNSPYYELHEVQCDYHEGVLILRGCVPSYFLKQIAQSLLIYLPSVEELDNHLKVA
jgi:hypothetical protein